MDEPTQSNRRKRGPYRVANRVPHSSLSAWVPADVHDRIARIAVARDVSVSHVVSRILVRTLQKPSTD